MTQLCGKVEGVEMYKTITQAEVVEQDMVVPISKP